MAEMLTNVNLSACQRPVYTSYELSEMVKRKRKDLNKTEVDFADLFSINVESVQQIEEGTRVFTKRLYKACSNILGIPVEKLIAMEEDDVSTFKTSNDNEDASQTFELANILFDEIILQCKLSARLYR